MIEKRPGAARNINCNSKKALLSRDSQILKNDRSVSGADYGDGSDEDGSIHLLHPSGDTCPKLLLDRARRAPVSAVPDQQPAPTTSGRPRRPSRAGRSRTIAWSAVFYFRLSCGRLLTAGGGGIAFSQA